MRKKEEKNRNKLNSYILLHLLLAIYSFSGVLSKLAASESFLSFKFCVLYGLIIVLLGVYAIAWQQIIKKIPLISAFANKAITVVWGLVWGKTFFSENITVFKIIGIIFIVTGIIVFSYSEKKGSDSNE